jgi:hypothetical protein
MRIDEFFSNITINIVFPVLLLHLPYFSLPFSSLDTEDKTSSTVVHVPVVQLRTFFPAQHFKLPGFDQILFHVLRLFSSHATHGLGPRTPWCALHHLLVLLQVLHQSAFLPIMPSKQPKKNNSKQPQQQQRPNKNRTD